MAKQLEILVIHGSGGGAYKEDAPLADFVRNHVSPSAKVAYPRFEGLEQSSAGWPLLRQELQAAVSELCECGSVIIAHSAGGAAILKLLSENGERYSPSGLFLLAPPYIGREGGWATDDFYLDDSFAEQLTGICDISLYHSRDDDIVPVAHLDMYAHKLPQAKVRLLDGYGHQFSERPFLELADDLAQHEGLRV